MEIQFFMISSYAPAVTSLPCLICLLFPTVLFENILYIDDVLK